VKIVNPTPFSELLFYLVIAILPFEEVISLGGTSMTKWVGLLFFFVSLANRRVFYGSVPRIFIAFFLYIGIGMSVDVLSFPLELDSLNELVRPVLMAILMIVAYNLSLNKKSGRIVTAIYLSSLVCARNSLCAGRQRSRPRRYGRPGSRIGRGREFHGLLYCIVRSSRDHLWV
jgi:hypothetical protein